MDVATFQASYPVFRTTDPTYLAATLARATRMHSPAVWGAQLDDGIGLLAAHWLTLDPMGTTTALKADARSTYGDQWDALKRAVVGGGFGVSSGACPSGGPGDGGPWWTP